MPAANARERNVLSTPKKASPSGAPLVRITWLSAEPASPAGRILTLMPVCFVNAARTFFDTANESWATSVIVTLLAADAGPAVAAVAARPADAAVAERVARASALRRLRLSLP